MTQDRVLLIRRTDNDNWAVPGGGMDLGESITQAAVRETWEETGITCQITGPGWHLHQPSQRDPLHQQRRGPAGVLYRLHRSASQRRAAAQQRVIRAAVGFPEDIPRLRMHPSMRQRIQRYLDKRRRPYLG